MASSMSSSAWTSSGRSTCSPPAGSGPNAAGRHNDPDRESGPRRRGRPTSDGTGSGTSAAYDLGKGQLHGYIKKTENRSRFLEFCRYLRSLHPADVRIAIICDNYSPHLTTKRCQRVGTWALANNVEIACTPTSSSWLNRIEARFTALRQFFLDGTDHVGHKEQGSMIRRCLIRRNEHTADGRLRKLVTGVNAG
jgi:transposase